MNSDVIINMQDAVVAYNDTTALRSISLQIHAGECIAVIGANGAGKTTLLTVINGFTPLTSGNVQVLGSAPAGKNATLLRRRIGYVAQTQPVDPRMPITLHESVMTGVYGRLGWRHKPQQRDHALVTDTLDSLRLLHLADRPLGHLSGGEQRRAMIARCLVQEPELILLDEPTASLDDDSRAIIMQLMDAVHEERGVTMLWVTHDLDALPAGCTRTLRMRNGAIVADMPHAPHRETEGAP